MLTLAQRARLVQGQEQGREGEELPPWELCHPLLASNVCETTQGVMYFTGADPAAFFISYNIQYSHPFETIHLFIKIKSSKRCIKPPYSVTKLNCHSESVFQNVVLLHPHHPTRALGSLAELLGRWHSLRGLRTMLSSNSLYAFAKINCVNPTGYFDCWNKPFKFNGEQ